MKIDIFTKAMGCKKLTYQNFSFLEVIHLKKKVSAEKKRLKDYVGNYIYENDQLQFFFQPEGYVQPDGSGNFDYVYSYLDHLGNVRLSYSDANNNGTIEVTSDPLTTEIIEENNYYPFGLKHKGYNNVVTSTNPAQDYKYNGVELEESLGLNLYEMEFRQYDPAIGRFTSIDPITHHTVTPYQAFDNNPVFWADPSGADSSMPDWLQKLWNSVPEGGAASWVFADNSSDSSDDSDESDNNTSNVTNNQNEMSPIWPFFGAFFGQFRHLTGPDAIALSFDVDVVPVGGVVISPIGVLLILKGPKRGSIEYIYDIGVAAGLDISAAGKVTELYFNGKTNDIKSTTFTGLRVEVEVSFAISGIEIGRGILYSPGDSNFIKNAVFGVSTSLGVGIPAPVMVNGNVSGGYTGLWKNLIKTIKDE